MTRLNEWPPVFLARLAETGNVTGSAKSAGIDWSTAYNRRRSDPEFAAKWRTALKEAGDLLEAEAWRRGVNGVERPVYQGGKKVGAVQEYSDTLLIFLLKGIRPGKFRDNVRHEHTGKGGKPIQHESEVTVKTDLEQCLTRFDRFARQGMGGAALPPNGN